MKRTEDARFWARAAVVLIVVDSQNRTLRESFYDKIFNELWERIHAPTPTDPNRINFFNL